jgi:3'-phosphoadenosine 5'-phosphosulfate (PAPS) 3'-phosphatase
MLQKLQKTLKTLMLKEIKDIIFNTRKGNIQIVEEKNDGDSATIADILIGELLTNVLSELLPTSIVINEESFNSKIFEQAKHTKYVWIVDPID